MNAKAEQKKRSHALILDAAAKRVREQGIAGARVAEVMKDADLTVGGFYAHFPSKDGLVDEALRLTSSRMRDRFFAGLEDIPEEGRVEVALERYLSPRHRDGASLGCPLPAVAGEVGSTAPQHRGVVAEQLLALIQGIERTLPKGGLLPRRALAIGLAALMYGGLTLARAVRGTPLSDEILRSCRDLGVAAARPSKR